MASRRFTSAGGSVAVSLAHERESESSDTSQPRPPKYVPFNEHLDSGVSFPVSEFGFGLPTTMPVIYISTLRSCHFFS